MHPTQFSYLQKRGKPITTNGVNPSELGRALEKIKNKTSGAPKSTNINESDFFHFAQHMAGKQPKSRQYNGSLLINGGFGEEFSKEELEKLGPIAREIALARGLNPNAFIQASPTQVELEKKYELLSEKNEKEKEKKKKFIPPNKSTSIATSTGPGTGPGTGHGTGSGPSFGTGVQYLELPDNSQFVKQSWMNGVENQRGLRKKLDAPGPRNGGARSKKNRSKLRTRNKSKNNQNRRNKNLKKRGSNKKRSANKKRNTKRRNSNKRNRK